MIKYKISETTSLDKSSNIKYYIITDINYIVQLKFMHNIEHISDKVKSKKYVRRINYGDYGISMTYLNIDYYNGL